MATARLEPINPATVTGRFPSRFVRSALRSVFRPSSSVQYNFKILQNLHDYPAQRHN